MADIKTAQTTWVSGMQFKATTGTGHSIVMDSAAEHGGEDAGPRPVELVLAALGGCTAMDVISILRKKRQPVAGLEVHVRGVQAPDFPHKFTDIHVEYVVHGNGVAPQAVARAIELSEQSYCSVSATLRGVAKITTSYRIEPVAEEQLQPA